jgi:glutathione synthase
MVLNVAVQMDPIERINIRGDSTFALLLEAQARAHQVSYYTPDQLALRDGKVSATVRPLTVRDKAGDHFTLGEPRHMALSSFDVVLLRQDPPFDLAYITSTHMLERIHPKTLVVNDPAHVRNAPEKVFVTEFPDLMPPTLITRDLTAIKAFRAEFGDIVMKPLYGKGGEAVFLLTREDLNFGSLYDMFAATFREPWVVQKFLPAVKQGDKRIILVDGEFAGARRPALQHGARRRAQGDRPHRARARNLRAAWTGATPARPAVRRYRRDRRFPHRDQRHLPHRHPVGEEFRRTRHRGADLGQNPSEASVQINMRLTLALDLLLRGAGEEGGAGEPAARGGFVDCVQQAGIEREVGFDWASGVEHEWHIGEDAAPRECRGNLGIAAQLFGRTWLWNFLTVGAGVFDPQCDRLDRAAQSRIDGRATRSAPWKIGHHDAERAGLTVYECDIACHGKPLSLPSGLARDCAGDARG